MAILDEEHRLAREVLDDVGAHEDVRLGNFITKALERHNGRLTRRALYGIVKQRMGNTVNFDRIGSSLRDEGKVTIHRQGAIEMWSLVRGEPQAP